MPSCPGVHIEPVHLFVGGWVAIQKHMVVMYKAFSKGYVQVMCVGLIFTALEIHYNTVNNG